MAIKIFYHIAPMEYWDEVVKEQAETMAVSGLTDAADEISICFAGDKATSTRLQIAELVAPGKAKVLYHSQLHQYEYSALHMLKNHTDAGDQVLYMHTKGVSHRPPARKAYDEWRRYLMWGCVERWRECIEALKEYQTVGVQWTRLDAHFRKLCGQDEVWAGNIWWARGDYICSLPCCEPTANRYLAEGWITSGKPTHKDLHNLTGGEPVTGIGKPNGPFAPGFSRASYTDSARMSRQTSEPSKTYTIPPGKPLISAAHTAAQTRGEAPPPDKKFVPVRRWDIINKIVAARGYKSYLEIGTYKRECFNRVSCPRKECIDPDPAANATHKCTSDEFFLNLPAGSVFDIIFIDGLHTEQQVMRDVHNSLQVLSANGCILMHDCQPETEREARDIPYYDGDGTVWVGTVWRAWARLRMTRPDLRMICFDTDNGVGYIDRQGQTCYPETDITWKLYWTDRINLLSRLSVDAAYKAVLEETA